MKIRIEVGKVHKRGRRSSRKIEERKKRKKRKKEKEHSAKLATQRVATQRMAGTATSKEGQGLCELKMCDGSKRKANARKDKAYVG